MSAPPFDPHAELEALFAPAEGAGTPQGDPAEQFEALFGGMQESPTLAPGVTMEDVLSAQATGELPPGLSMLEHFRMGAEQSILGQAAGRLAPKVLNEALGDAPRLLRFLGGAVGAVPEAALDDLAPPELKGRSEREYALESLSGVKPGRLRRMGRMTAGLAGSLTGDLPVFGVAGRIMGPVMKQLPYVAQLSKTAASAGRGARAAALTVGATQAAGVFGQVGATREIVRQAISDDPWDLSHIVEEAGKEAALGAAFGAAGQVPGGAAGRFGAEVGTFALVPSALEGRLPTEDDFLGALGAVAMFRAFHIRQTMEGAALARFRKRVQARQESLTEAQTAVLDLVEKVAGETFKDPEMGAEARDVLAHEMLAGRFDLSQLQPKTEGPEARTRARAEARIERTQREAAAEAAPAEPAPGPDPNRRQLDVEPRRPVPREITEDDVAFQRQEAREEAGRPQELTQQEMADWLEVQNRRVERGEAAWGDEVTLELADGSRVKGRYLLHEIDQSIPSHIPLDTGGFGKELRHPAGGQEKRYDLDPDLARLVRDNIKDPSIDRLTAIDPTGQSGPSDITPEGVVRGGNRRKLVQLGVYMGQGQQTPKWMREKILVGASRFGIDPAKGENMAAPTVDLVMLDRWPKDAREGTVLSTILNRPPSATPDPVTRGATLAASLSERTMETFERVMTTAATSVTKGDAGPTIRAALRQDREFVQGLERDGVILPDERNQMVDKDGTLTAEGLLRAERVVAGAIVPDGQLLKSAPDQLRQRLMRISPQVLRAEGVQRNVLIPLLTEAVRSEVQRQGLAKPGKAPPSVIDFVRTQDAFNPAPSQTDARVAQVHIALVGPPKDTAAAASFRRFAEIVTDSVEGQAGIFEGRPPLEREAFDEAFGAPPFPVTTANDRYTREGGEEQRRIDNEGPVDVAEKQLDLLVDGAQRMDVESVKGGERRVSSVRSGAVTLAGDISANLRNLGAAEIVGRRLTTPREAAVALQPLRNPAFENFYYVAIAGGEVVATRHVTSRMPGSTAVATFRPSVGRTIQQLRRSGRQPKAEIVEARELKRHSHMMNRWLDRVAKHVGVAPGEVRLVVAHNHPSGKAAPSKPDVQATQVLKTQIPRLKFHLVLDSGEYGLIEPPVKGGPTTTSTRPLPPEVTRAGDAAKEPRYPARYLGRRTKNTAEVMRVFSEAGMLSPETAVGVLYLDANLKVVGAQLVPERVFSAQLTPSRKSEKGKGARIGELPAQSWLRGQGLKVFGAQSAVASYTGASGEVRGVLDSLVRNGTLGNAYFPNERRHSRQDPAVEERLQDALGRGVAFGESRRKFGGVSVRSGEKPPGRRGTEVREDVDQIEPSPVPPEPRGESAPQTREDLPTRVRKRGIPPGFEVEVADREPKFRYTANTFMPEARDFIETWIPRLGETLEVGRRGRVSRETQAAMAEKWGMTVEEYIAMSQGMLLPVEGQVRLASFIDRGVRAISAKVDEIARATAEGNAPKKAALEAELEAMEAQVAKLLVPWYSVGSEAGRTLGARARNAKNKLGIPIISNLEARAIRQVMDSDRLDVPSQEKLIQDVVASQRLPPDARRRKIREVIQTAHKPSWWDKLMEFRIMSLLSSPVTQGRNILGNTAAATSRLIETAVGIPVDAAYGVASRALGKDAGPSQRHQMELWADMFGSWQGLLEGSRQGLLALKNEEFAMARGRLESEAGIHTPKIAGTPIEDVAGPILRLPGRALAAADLFFFHIARTGEIYRLAARQTINEKRVGPSRWVRVKELADQALNVPHPEAEAIAKRIFQDPASGGVVETGTTPMKFEAERRMIDTIAGRGEAKGLEFTFRQPLEGLAARFDKARFDPGAGAKAARLMVPFFPTPVNITRFNAQRLPFLAQFASPKNLRDIKSGNRELAVESYTRMLVGGAVFAPLLVMALDGYLTGEPPQDRAARDQARSFGHQYQSIQIGGQWFSYRGFSPMTELMTLAAEVAEQVTRGDVPTETMMTQVAFATARATLDQPFMTGIADLIKAVQEGDEYGERRIATVGQNLVSGTVVPRGLAFLARALDPTLRAFPEDTATRLLLDIPNTRRNQLPLLDQLGRTYDNPSSWLSAMVQNNETKPHTPLDGWLHTIMESPDKAVIGYSQRRQMGRRLESDDYYRFLQRRGEILVPALERMAADRRLRRMPVEVQRSFAEDAEREAQRHTRFREMPRIELRALELPDTPRNRARVRALLDSRDGSLSWYSASERTDDEKRRFLTTGRIR